jgi:hypothetical protein
MIYGGAGGDRRRVDAPPSAGSVDVARRLLWDILESPPEKSRN